MKPQNLLHLHFPKMNLIRGAIFWIASIECLFAQEINLLHYEEACKAVREHSKLKSNEELITKISQLNSKNLNSAWLPQATFYSQASWQSEVTKVDIPIAGIIVPEMSRDQYRLWAEVNQLIYDGGTIHYQIKLEKIQATIATLDHEMQLDILEQQIDGIFFQVNLLRKQAQILQWQKNALQAQFTACMSKKANGWITPGGCSLWESHIVQAEQKIIENASEHASQMEQLRLLTGLALNDSAKLIFPSYTLNSYDAYNRKDFKILYLNMEVADIRSKVARAHLRPIAAAYANVGYGRPGLNMLNPDFKPYFLGGIRLSLPMAQWNRTYREAEVAQLQRRIIANKIDNLTQSLDVKKTAFDYEIFKLEALIDKDQRLIELRQRITAEALSQYKNGVLTSSEITTRIAEEAEARILAEIHKLQLEFARFKKHRLINN